MGTWFLFIHESYDSKDILLWFSILFSLTITQTKYITRNWLSLFWHVLQVTLKSLTMILYQSSTITCVYISACAFPTWGDFLVLSDTEEKQGSME